MKTSAHRAPAALVSLAFLFAAALPLAAQLTPQQDPANLAGERVSPPDLADTLPLNHGAPALEQLLRKLRTRASFMLIVAHPDDEDNGMLTYLSRGKGARVATLTLNRGEGGQNLMSGDFDDALGLIRTQELLAADRYMGVDQFFGTEVDFGFSKTKEEAFAKWTHDRVLYDAVRAIRLYRPLVIASVFIGEPSDGHGQHQVSGQIAQEAFKAAGDPNVFPDQIAAGLQPWQPLKVYARSPFGRIDAQGMYDYATSQYVPARFNNYVTGKVTDTVPKANVTIPEGDTDPLLGGDSYAQFGREGRNLQRSQIGGGGGPGRGGPGGRADVSYHRYGSKLNQPDGDDSGLESGFYDGIDTSLPGIATLAPEVADTLRPGLEKIDQQIAEAQRLFDPAKPELTAPLLRVALSTLDGFIHELEDANVNDLPPTETYNLLHELHIKRVQLNNALAVALGLSLEAYTNGSEIYAGTKSWVDITAHSRPSAPLTIKHGWVTNSVGQIQNWTAEKTPGTRFPGSLPASAILAPEFTSNLTRPYFTRTSIESPVYTLLQPALRDAPQSPPAVTAWADWDYEGTTLTVGAVALGGYPEAVGGPTQFVPPVNIALSRQTQILPKDTKQFPVDVSVSNFNIPVGQGNAAIGEFFFYATPDKLQRAQVSLKLPLGWSAPPAAAGAKPETFRFDIHPGSGIPSGVDVAATAKADDGRSYSEGFRPVGYPGLTYTNYYTPATLRVVPVDVTSAPNLNIAYIPGTGDDVPSALDQLGVHPYILTTANLTPESLKPYDAVILGVRAYQHSDIAAANAALNAYAAAGGIVIAQYNTGRLPEGTGPYPLDLGSSQNVVEEDAPVKIVAPDNPLLTWPNKITTADFDGWVEERGHGFMATWDPHYTPLLETHDHGQAPQLGGLLVARTGRGAWIYLGLAVYRQLPEGVPGSYRLLANLISAAKNPALAATPQPIH